MISSHPCKSGDPCQSKEVLDESKSALSEVAPKSSGLVQEKQEREEDSFLSVKFQKLVVSLNNPKTCQKKQELKSEKEVIQLKKSCKKSVNKAILRKSKLGESFCKFRTPADLTTAIQDSKAVVTTTENQKIFGRKFSISLENFGGLSLLEKKDAEESDDASNYSTDSFKSLNGPGSKRKRATTPETEELEAPAMVSCGQQARLYSDVTADELAGYLEDTTFFPKRMSYMAEMMYT